MVVFSDSFGYFELGISNQAPQKKNMIEQKRVEFNTIELMTIRQKMVQESKINR